MGADVSSHRIPATLGPRQMRSWWPEFRRTPESAFRTRAVAVGWPAGCSQQPLESVWIRGATLELLARRTHTSGIAKGLAWTASPRMACQQALPEPIDGECVGACKTALGATVGFCGP